MVLNMNQFFKNYSFGHALYLILLMEWNSNLYCMQQLHYKKCSHSYLFGMTTIPVFDLRLCSQLTSLS